MFENQTRRIKETRDAQPIGIFLTEEHFKMLELIRKLNEEGVKCNSDNVADIILQKVKNGRRMV